MAKLLNEDIDLLDQSTYEDLTTLFKMFADQTRLKILTVLAHQECSVNELTETIGLSQSAISHQLSTLRATNLVKYRKDKQTVFYSLTDDHVMMIFRQALEHVHE